MKLRRVEIRHFRKLEGPLALNGLDDGLTLLVGDNEEGKSTVLAALKAAFFEQHTVGGEIRKAMTPRSGETPAVEIDFELGGAAYRLRKQFKRGGVVLESPQGRLRDDAAEQALQTMLRFERRQGRGEPKPQHQGLQALFWIDQGTTFRIEAEDPIAACRDRVGRAIAGEVDAVATGDRARRIIEAVGAGHARFWTGGGKERGELKALRERIDELERECQTLGSRRRQYDLTVDKLARRREERQRFLAADPKGEALRKLRAARDDLKVVEDLQAQHALLAADLDAKTHAAKLVMDQVERRKRLAQKLADGRAELAQASDELSQLDRKCATADAAANAAVAAETEAVRSLIEAEQAYKLARQRQDLAVEAARLARLMEDRDKASRAAEALRLCKAELAQERMTPARMKAIREADSTRREAAAALQAVATRLELEPAPGASVRRDGKVIDPAQGLYLTERTALDLEPFGRVVIVPGGSDVEERRASLRRAAERLVGALSAVGAADLGAAEAALDRRRSLEDDLARHDQQLRTLLDSHGLADLAELGDLVAVLERKVAGLRQTLDAAGAERPAADAVERPLAELETARDAAQRSREAAQAASKDAADDVSALRQRRAKCQGGRDELERQTADQQQQLDELVAAESEAALTERLQQAVIAKVAVEKSLADIGRQIAAAQPDLARDRVDGLERRVKDLATAARQLDDDIRDLQGELRGLANDVFDERQDELARDLVTARAELARLEREARAWRLLQGALDEARQAATEAFLEPVRQSILPYMQRLFPGGELLLDPERMTLTHLRRDGVDEPFRSLSVGTREQIAVLVRLAFARLLLEREGETSCLILDDALVYADETRFETMRTILQRAARDLQIIVLTCRPRDYLGLDARQIRLDDCRL